MGGSKGRQQAPQGEGVDISRGPIRTRSKPRAERDQRRAKQQRTRQESR